MLSEYRITIYETVRKTMIVQAESEDAARIMLDDYEPEDISILDSSLEVVEL